jgi:hypothetical protein
MSHWIKRVSRQIQGGTRSMIVRNSILPACFAIVAAVGAFPPCFGGTITFTGDAALVSALGTTMSTGVNEVALGQTVTIPFSATVTGVESVSGSVVLSDTSSGGTISLENVVFTVLNSTSTSANFGISVTHQVFYSPGPTTLSAIETATASTYLTAPGVQVLPGTTLLDPSVSFTPKIYPDNYNNSTSVIPEGLSLFAYPSDTYPIDESFAPFSNLITGIPKVTSQSLSALDFSYSTSINVFNLSNIGAGSSTTLDVGSFGFMDPTSVPEPSSTALLVVGVSGVLFAYRRRGSKSRKSKTVVPSA